MAKNVFQVGDRVQYRSGGHWRPFGVVIDILPGITMNGAWMSGPTYKVRWDNGDESGWLSHYDLVRIKDSGSVEA